MVVVLATFAIGVLALTAFVWAWRRGLFHDLVAQSRVIFQPEDLRLSRRWETPAQRLERESGYGPAEALPGIAAIRHSDRGAGARLAVASEDDCFSWLASKVLPVVSLGSWHLGDEEFMVRSNRWKEAECNVIG